MTCLIQMSDRSSLKNFCVRLDGLSLSSTENALAILWFLHEKDGRQNSTSGELARHIRESGLGNPNSTNLKQSLIKSKKVLRKGDRLSLKPTSIESVKLSISQILAPEQPKINESDEFISNQVWKETRGYIEKIAAQINGCYHNAYYDGASVLSRKLVEILLIEAFENAGKDDDIKDSSGEFFMLSKLIDSTLGNDGLSLGRETKKILKQVKAIGDRSAHNRRYIAIKSDLDGIKLGYRLLIEELLHLAGLR